MLLAHKNPPVNVDHLTQDHETALLSAAHFGYTDVVAQLIAKGADVTIRNIRDESALDLAAQYGRLEVVQHLLRVMPQLVDPYNLPKCRSKLFSSTPLHRASKNGRKEVVQVLLAAGIDPNIRTHNGTPLHEAACFRKASVVRILLANGADLNATDRRGMTVHDLLADYSEEATRKVRRVIREFENHSRITYESEEELPPFPVQDYSPTSYPLPNIVKAPETQEKTNKIKSFVSPSSSSQLTKHQSQSFVKKLASKCLGLKAKFNSAPNISNNSAQESEDGVKSKHSENKHSTNTLLIGNSKFFKKLSKKEETGEIVCTDEFDTISLDRLSTLNRDSTVNRSNRSCPGFKTSLPNISENNEHSDSQESVAESVVMTEIDCDKNKEAISEVNEAVNYNAYNIAMKPHSIEKKRISVTSNDSANLVNECYEAYEFAEEEPIPGRDSIPRPPPRPNMTVRSTNSESETIYENVTACSKITRPTPAARTHIPTKMPVVAAEKNVLYENVSLIKEKNTPEPPKRTLYPTLSEIGSESISTRSRSSTLSSDSLIDETNLEDILLSQKSKSFRHSKLTEDFLKMSKSNISRTSSNSSDSSNFTETSAIENVDCSGDANDKSIYLSMTGTMPHKKNTTSKEKKVLFRHKTFTNIEVDRNSVKLKALPFFKETLAHYHIRGTGHCIYSGPTLSEFIYVFNRDTLYKDVPPFTKVPNDRRDSYFETAICFCRPKPPKFHSSAEDLLDAQPQEEKESVFIDMDALKRNREMKSTSFRCFCDSNDCTFHSEKRDTGNLVVKFSAIKKSISTPDITLNYSPSSTVRNVGLIKNKSVPSNLEEPYAVVTLEHIVARQKNAQNKNTDLNSPEYVSMSPSTFSSNSSNRPYSLKDISDVISLTSSTTTSQTRASDSNHLPLRKSSSSEHSGHWSLQSCNSNVTIKSDASFVTCFEESEEESDSEHTLHSDEEISDTETVKSEISTAKRPWVHSDSFRFGNAKFEPDVITEEKDSSDSKFESGISVDDSDSSSSEGGDDSGVPRVDADVSLVASLERGCGVGAGVRSGSGRRRWDEAEGTSEGDALSVSSAASSCAPLHLAHHHEYSKVSVMNIGITGEHRKQMNIRIPSKLEKSPLTFPMFSSPSSNFSIIKHQSIRQVFCSSMILAAKFRSIVTSLQVKLVNPRLIISKNSFYECRIEINSDDEFQAQAVIRNGTSRSFVRYTKFSSYLFYASITIFSYNFLHLSDVIFTDQLSSSKIEHRSSRTSLCIATDEKTDEKIPKLYRCILFIRDLRFFFKNAVLLSYSLNFNPVFIIYFCLLQIKASIFRKHQQILIKQIFRFRERRAPRVREQPPLQHQQAQPGNRASQTTPSCPAPDGPGHGARAAVARAVRAARARRAPRVREQPPLQHQQAQPGNRASRTTPSCPAPDGPGHGARAAVARAVRAARAVRERPVNTTRLRFVFIFPDCAGHIIVHKCMRKHKCTPCSFTLRARWDSNLTRSERDLAQDQRLNVLSEARGTHFWPDPGIEPGSSGAAVALKCDPLTAAPPRQLDQEGIMR
ncbi:hypothetical protein ABMA27_012936 [Loxostege sticticalis]|uniref:Uncharacterized protein n=1 Tax=Loxostege sticticalis TaxID=481309 RepID=A0ABR3H0H2_LOXSC